MGLLLFQISKSNLKKIDCAVTRFGLDRVFEVSEEHMPNQYLFMTAASYKENVLSIIYFLLRHVPSCVDCPSSSGYFHEKIL